MARRAHDPPILLVEDKDSLRIMLRHALENQGHTVIEARDQQEAVAALQTLQPGVVLSDLRLTDGDGFGVLRAAKELDPELPVIVMTAFGSIEDAVSAMKEGALDFLAKPVDPDHLLLLVERALSQRRLVTENMVLKEELALKRGAPQIVGDHPRLKQVTLALQRAAASDATVLLEGESGTGKELFARALHALSTRADGPFVAINCAAIPETLLESEIFGHEKGAFTGAHDRRTGVFELAHRGTLFLDEIAEMMPATQVKLLRVLQERTFRRLGGRQEQTVDVRVIAATNQNPSDAVKSGKLREDLYYRLNVFAMELPPLRERKEDIPLLAQHFLSEFNERNGKSVRAVDQESLYLLEQYPWPGNIRELRNVMERATILAEGDFIEPKHLPATLVAKGEETLPTVTLSPGTTVDEAERRLILLTLDHTRNNKTRAAEILGISLKTLHNKLNRMRDQAASRLGGGLKRE
jgi:DNA-binding NtrC family response regulator